MLNLGSSTRHFRQVEQPHVARELIRPLEAAGVEIVHSDLKAADGVDIAGDVREPEVAATLRMRGFRCALCANLLEHVRDPAAFAAACEEIVGPDRLILATVPSSYPYHADPIDAGYRPTPEALAALFARSTPLLAEEVSGDSYAGRIRAGGGTAVGEAARTVLAGLVAVARPKSFRARLDRWRWYRRPYKVSLVLVRVRT